MISGPCADVVQGRSVFGGQRHLPLVLGMYARYPAIIFPRTPYRYSVLRLVLHRVRGQRHHRHFVASWPTSSNRPRNIFTAVPSPGHPRPFYSPPPFPPCRPVSSDVYSVSEEAVHQHHLPSAGVFKNFVLADIVLVG